MTLLRKVFFIVAFASFFVPRLAQAALPEALSANETNGLGNIIAYLSRADATLSCPDAMQTLESMFNQYQLDKASIATVKEEGCTGYFFKQYFLGKVCCQVETDGKTSAPATTLKTGASFSITGLSADSGDIGGSKSVAIYGSNFTDSMRVSFGGINGTNVLSYGSYLFVDAPAHAPGAVDVTVTNQCGEKVVLPNGYTYAAQPQINSISPTTGHIGGSRQLVLAGKNFSSAPTPPTVTVDGLPASNVSTQAGGRTLIIDVPPHAAGTVDIVVQNASGPSATAPGLYTYAAVPVVTSVSEPSGHVGGSKNLAIYGANFSQTAGLPTVSFGGVAGTNVTVYSGGSVLYVDPPAHEAGTVNIALANSDGVAATATPAYAYATQPVITTVGSVSGDTHGSRNMLLIGHNFSSQPSAPAVAFGGTAATAVTSSGNSLFVDPPAHAAGTVDIQVTNPGSSSTTASNAYTYTSQPTVSLLTPGTGTVDGTKNVMIVGANFSYYPALPTVTFGDKPATDISVESNGEILRVTTPAHVSGAVPVTVTNSSGASVSYTGYTYVGDLMCFKTKIASTLLPLLLSE